MGDQTVKEKFSTPDGLSMEITLDSGSTYLDAGVMDDGASFIHEYDAPQVEFGNQQNPAPIAKNQKLQMNPSEIVSWDSEVLTALSAGLVTRTAIAGTPVAGATQLIASGDWEFDKMILLEGQNASGLVPTINSVTGSVDGAGAADDWTTVQGAGGWFLIPLDGTNFTTEVQTLTIDYDYTPASGYNLTAGTTSQVLTEVGVRFTHYTNDALTAYDWRITCPRVFPNGGITLNKLGSKSGNDYDKWSIALTAERDNTQTDGEQLFTLFTTD